jgi:hypothetical protein
MLEVTKYTLLGFRLVEAGGHVATDGHERREGR